MMHAVQPPQHRHLVEHNVLSIDDEIKDQKAQYRGEAGAREAGRLRLEGKEYRVREGDVLHFRFNV